MMIIANNLSNHDDIALVALLKDCAKQKDLLRGIKLHADIFKCSLVNRNVFIGNTLIFMYAKCGALAKAQQVFDELPIHTLVSWTALLVGFSQYGYGEKALLTLECMQQKGFSPDASTFACTLKACASITAAEKGLHIHAESIRHGFLRNNSVLGSALVDMYAKCGALAKAQQVFDELMLSRNVVSWNALITGYCQHGHGEDALRCFERMNDEGYSPDGLTFSCALKACGSIRAADKGKEIHTEIARKSLLEGDTILGNALVDMYAKCGEISKGQEVFDRLIVRNIVAWTTIIIGYCQCRHESEALACFERMKSEGLSPDAVTLASMLQACGSLGVAALGEEIHGEILRNGFLDTVLGNILVDMYARCGALVRAQQVFDKLLVHDIVSWNVLIARYCEHGKGREALTCFEQLMQQNAVCPDAITFACILRACISVGAVKKAQMIYEMMSTRYGIIPSVEHHSCMVDLFGRAGHFEKALAILKNMPISDHLPAWFAFLGSCLRWGNVKLGRLAFKNVVQLDSKSAAAYVSMSKLYATALMRENADNLETLRMGIRG